MTIAIAYCSGANPAMISDTNSDTFGENESRPDTRYEDWAGLSAKIEIKKGFKGLGEEIGLSLAAMEKRYEDFQTKNSLGRSFRESRR
jgi:hypothetical protein